MFYELSILPCSSEKPIKWPEFSEEENVTIAKYISATKLHTQIQRTTNDIRFAHIV